MNKQNCWFGGAVVGVVSVYVFLSIKKSSNSPCLFLSHQSEFISFLKSLLIGPWERLQPLGTQGCLMHFPSLFCGFLHVQLLFPTEQIWSLKLGMLCLFFFFLKLHGDPNPVLAKQWHFTNAGQSDWLLDSFFHIINSKQVAEPLWASVFSSIRWG